MARPSELRRAQAAATTHNAIIDAARDLFAERGYVFTTIEQVAKRADVSQATVYAVAGGKRGLLRSLVQRWGDSPVTSRGREELPLLETAGEVVAYVGRANRLIREEHGVIIRILLATAALNSEIAVELKDATAGFRSFTSWVAGELTARGVAGEQAWVADVVWFYFGYSGYFTLVDDNGWSFEEAERWLVAQCCSALGTSPPH
jgi:AcrR family transcriptional regulator